MIFLYNHTKYKQNKSKIYPESQSNHQQTETKYNTVKLELDSKCK